MNTSLTRFFAISLALHLLTLAFLKLQPLRAIKQAKTIPVTILPRSENETTPSPKLRVPPTPNSAPRPRASKNTDTPGLLAKKTFGTPKETSQLPVPNKISPPAKPREEPPARDIVPEKTVVAERPLPTIKDILPSASYASNTRAENAVNLNTRDPLYVSYFTKIKQNIEQQWIYPELALRYGLQGRLLLEFVIGGNGQLEQLRIVRSSGSELLDGEAVRAIKASAPFPPIPSWIKTVPLLISASMEYHDDRRFTR